MLGEGRKTHSRNARCEVGLVGFVLSALKRRYKRISVIVFTSIEISDNRISLIAVADDAAFLAVTDSLEHRVVDDEARVFDLGRIRGFGEEAPVVIGREDAVAAVLATAS